MKNISDKQSLFRAIYANNHMAFTLALLFTALSTGCNLFFSWILGAVIDAVSSGDRSALKSIGILMLLSMPFLFLIEAGMRVSSAHFIHKGLRQYKECVFSAITQKSISAFTTENTATYLSGLTNDASRIADGYIAGSISLAYYFLMFFLTLAMMLRYSLLMTFVVILLCMLPIMVSVIMGNGLTIREKSVSDKNTAFTARLKDLLGGFAVIKSFKAEDRTVKIFHDENSLLETVKEQRRRYSGLLRASSETAGLIVQFGIFFVGAMLAINGQISAGTVLIFVNLTNFLIQPIQSIPELAADRKAAISLIDKMAALLKMNAETADLPAIKNFSEGIRIRELSFGYEQDKPVLNQLTCNFEAGKCYAIVGSSGSGKSTLLNLLLGAYQNYQGSLKLDECEIRCVSPDSIYDIMSLIGQSVFIFDDTIRNNITMFAQFSDEEVNRAIRMAGLAEIIQERGESYRCGENGVNLSGGERQRISIARSLLKGSKVLLVDEATSALDNETARHIGNALLSLKGLTRIVVTHRLDEALLKLYDGIILLKNGAVCEQGSFDELMSRKGSFYALYTVTND